MGKSALFSVSGSNGTRSAIISVSGTRRWSAWGATIFGTRGWSAWGATISVSGPFLAPKIEAGRSRAGPNGNRDTWSDQRVRLERGPLSVRSLQLHLYCRSHPEWWITDSFDGPEDTYVHHKEDSANYNERSSMTREAWALVGWRFTHVKSKMDVRQNPWFRLIPIRYAARRSKTFLI